MLGGNTPSTFLSTYLPVYPSISTSLLSMTEQCLVYSTYLNWDEKLCESMMRSLLLGHSECIAFLYVFVCVYVQLCGSTCPPAFTGKRSTSRVVPWGAFILFFKPWSLTGILTCRLGKAGWPASYSFDLTILILGL